MRNLLKENVPDFTNIDPVQSLSYLATLKNILGNLNNDVGFAASLLVKTFLKNRFGVAFDAAFKPQGAPGIDINLRTFDGRRIVAEIKTTKPYQPNFGAKQREEIRKDLDPLARTEADYKLYVRH